MHIEWNIYLKKKKHEKNWEYHVPLQKSTASKVTFFFLPGNGKHAKKQMKSELVFDILKRQTEHST